MSEQVPQTADQIKHMLINTLIQHYSAMVGFIKNLPIDQAFLSNALLNLDQGFMWSEKAILRMNFSPAAAPASESVAPEQPAAKVTVTKVEPAAPEVDGA